MQVHGKHETLPCVICHVSVAGTVNAQALACNSMHAIAASDQRHVAVFARAGAISWLVGLLHQWPCHPCGRNAALTLKEILQNPDYQVWLHWLCSCFTGHQDDHTTLSCTNDLFRVMKSNVLRW